jgi:hypothetical protein
LPATGKVREVGYGQKDLAFYRDNKELLFYLNLQKRSSNMLLVERENDHPCGLSTINHHQYMSKLGRNTEK